jgi:cytochrome c oxidase assembly protein subunit 11
MIRNTFQFTARHRQYIGRQFPNSQSNINSTPKCIAQLPKNNLRYNNTKAETIKLTESQAAALAQRRAYEYYRRKNGLPSSKNTSKGQQQQQQHQSTSDTIRDRNIQIASYAAAAVIGALGATYAAVPLYKVFCQTTGFGGTTQRVKLADWAESQEERENTGRSKVSQALWEKLVNLSNVPREMLPSSPGTSHGRGAKTWTDEEAAAKLASLRPCKDGKLITVRFDSTVGDVLPWSFVPTQLDVKVVPGETALSFFTATNHSDKAITGVATYNVHPPKVGLYFNKIQCFCFEEQRLLPGETVDMPVFFFIDPEIMDDPQLKNVRSVTLSYTFFQTDMDDEEEDDEEEAA